MEWWLVALLATLLASLLILIAPFRLDLSLEARGEPSGFWAVAGGVVCGPFGVTGVAARGVPSTVQLRVFGRTLKTLKPAADSSRSIDDVGRGIKSVGERVEVLPVAEWLVGERKRIRIERLELQLAYSFANVVLTGQMIAATSMLAGVLPPPIRLQSAPSWQLVDRASLAVDGRIRIWPGLFALDALRFWVKNRRVFKRRAEA